MKRAWMALTVTLIACGAESHVQTPVEHPHQEMAPVVTEAPAPAPAPPSEVATHAEESVRVRGIEGSMSNYDVRTTMEQRAAELAACHEPRARAVPALSGTVEYAIALDAAGNVQGVTLKSSNLGDRTVERCVSEVISATPFPKPNGGDANVTWSMILEPLNPNLEPEAWDQEQIAKVIDKQLPKLHESCEMEQQKRKLDVTAYVNKKGRVVAASVMPRNGAEVEEADCIVLALRKWPMPRPKQKRFAKVSFELTSAQPALMAKAKVAKKSPSKRR